MIFQSHDQRFGGFLAFGEEMAMEKIMVCAVFMKMMRRQHNRKNGDFGFQLRLHHTFNDSLSNEFVLIDATVNDKASSHNGAVTASFGE